MKITNLYPDLTALMVLDNSALSVSVTPKAEELKLKALEQSSPVERVDNATQQEIAVAAQLALDNVMRATEKARKSIKAPVIELGRKIDSQAEAFIKELQDERYRVTKLLADFQALELARVRAAEAATRLEAESLERKRQEELATATDLDHIDAIQERFNAQSAELASKPIPVAAKAEGQVVRNDWDVVVTDPYKLARYHPQCVTITAKVGEIKQLLQQGITVNGVTAIPIIKSGTRAASSQKLIEV
jgi:hypothetical protein